MQVEFVEKARLLIILSPKQGYPKSIYSIIMIKNWFISPKNLMYCFITFDSIQMLTQNNFKSNLKRTVILIFKTANKKECRIFLFFYFLWFSINLVTLSLIWLC